MKRVIDVEIALVHDLLDRFESVSIPASFTHHLNPYGSPGSTDFVTVWVPAESDPALVRQVVAAYLEHAASTRSQVVCDDCGYDLRGHRGRAACPECGKHLVAPVPELTCTRCGQRVPANFETCWNCSADMHRALRSTDT